MDGDRVSTRDLEQALDLHRELWRQRCRDELLCWVTHVLAPLDQKPAAHHRLIIRKLEELANGRLDRLMIFAPPRHGKSEMVSRLLPG